MQRVDLPIYLTIFHADEEMLHVILLSYRTSKFHSQSLVKFASLSLVHAVNKGSVDMVKMLLECRYTNVNHQYHRYEKINHEYLIGPTALHCTIFSGRTELVQLILSHGDIDIRHKIRGGTTD
jgi:hypothetical protein